MPHTVITDKIMGLFYPVLTIRYHIQCQESELAYSFKIMSFCLFLGGFFTWFGLI